MVRKHSVAVTAQEQARNGYVASVGGAKLLGEIVTWAPRQGTTPKKHTEISAALEAAGLDATLSREIPPKSAFNRACRKLSEARIIRMLDEDENECRFQFTRESKGNDGYEYQKETTLTLDKTTGKVGCPLPGLATLAQEELDRCIEYRQTSDVTAIVHRAFDAYAEECLGSKGGTIFNLPDARAVYMVLAEHQPFLTKVYTFLESLGWRMNRIPIAAGTSYGERTVRETVADGLGRLIREYEEAVETFGLDTRASTLERAAERIQTARFKVEAYAEYLGEERSRLLECVEQAQVQLRRRVAQIDVVRDADHSTECDHCHAPLAVTQVEVESRIPRVVCGLCGKTSLIEWDDDDKGETNAA